MNRGYNNLLKFKGNLKPFIITIDTTVDSSLTLTDSNQFRAPFHQFITNGPAYLSDDLNVTIDWGDGTQDLINNFNDTRLTHTYSVGGVYVVKLFSRNFYGFCFDYLQSGDTTTHDGLKLSTIEEWGGFIFTSLNTFRNCWRMISNAIDIPLIATDNMSGTFNRAIEFNSPVAHWDWSAVTNYGDLFGDFNFRPAPYNKGMSFNQNVGDLPIQNATNITGMFGGQRYPNAFNNGGSPSINDWDVSNTFSGNSIFRRCADFNQPLQNWNIENWTRADFMLNLTAYNQPLGNWKPINITNLTNFLGGNNSFTHLDDLYQKWSLLNLKSNVNASFGNNNYTSAGQAGKDVLENTFNWGITDGGII